MSASNHAFTSWPWQYSFPPFFTLQPNLSTRVKQLEAWSNLVLDYCQTNQVYTLTVAEAAKSELFCNAKIDRRLSREGVEAVCEHLSKSGHLEWIGKDRQQCHIHWRRPEEWGKLLHDWARANGFVNTVHTLLELTSDDSDSPAVGLDEQILLKALRHLQSAGRAEIIGDNEGVKFF